MSAPKGLLCALLLGIVLAGCAPKQIVTVTLQDDTGQVSEVRVKAQVAVAGSARLAVIDDGAKAVPQLAFELELPDQAEGLLSVQVKGLNGTGCLSARGSNSAAVEDALRHGLVVKLKQVDTSCQVRVNLLGNGTGKVSAQRLDDRQGGEAPKSCTTEQSQAGASECLLSGTYQAKYELIAEPTGSSVFLGWSAPGCSLLGPCVVTVEDPLSQITARFEPTRICNAAGVCWENPLPAGTDLHAVSGTADGDLWAVGAHGAIARRESGIWYSVPNLFATTLTGVFIAGPDDVWIVGNCQLIQHWTGRGLQVVSPPAYPCAKGPSLNAVWGSSPKDIWAVGQDGLVLHYDGTSWTPVAVPTRETLTAVHGADSRNVLIGGAHGTVLRWDGQSFTQTVVSPAAGIYGVFVEQGGQAWLSGGTGSEAVILGGSLVDLRFTVAYSLATAPFRSLWADGAGSVWAAGGYNRVSRGRRERSGQMSWQELQTGVSELSFLFGIWGRSSEDLWVVGMGGTRLHWNGAYFSSELGGLQPTQFTAVHGSSSAVWVGGTEILATKAASGLLPAWQRLSPTVSALRVLNNGTVWLAEAGLITRISDTVSFGPAAGEHLRGLDVSNLTGDGTPLFAVGDAGYLLTLRNGAWMSDTVTGTPTPNLHAVSALSADEALAVGDSGLVVQWRSSSTGMQRPLAFRYTDQYYDPYQMKTVVPNLKGIHASRPDNVWMVGELGAVYLYDHTRSIALNLRTPVAVATDPYISDFNSVWAYHEVAPDGTLLLRGAWLAGSGGRLVHVRLPTAAGSTPAVVDVHSGTQLPLRSVWGRQPDDIWAVGANGVMLHYVGAQALKP